MIALLIGLAAAMAAPAASAPKVLTVCADPNNLPFSNQAGEGFENKLAELIARDMGAKLEYLWWAQRRGYVRNTLNEAKCDIWPGVATGVDMVSTTRPYYRSTYMFVSRSNSPFQGLTLDDPRLAKATIGVQMVGNDHMNTPPAHALAERGMIDNVRGYMLYGDYARPNPPAAIVDAVSSGEVDVAMVWGPLAGYFARRSSVPLRLEAVTPSLDRGQWPMTYDVSVGVRRQEPELKAQVQAILDREAPAIRDLLQSYGVPTTPPKRDKPEI